MEAHPPTPRSSFVAAVVQAAPEFLDLDATVDKAVALIGEAAARGAQIVAFPETWIPGYPFFAWLGAPAWGMQFVRRYHENSLVLGSPQDRRLSAAAAEHDIAVVIGYSERDGGSLYMGQRLIASDGTTVAARRKLKPTHVERTIFGEGDGSDIAVHDTEVGRLGALCCWEHLQPLTKYAMYAQGEQVHVAAWPSFSLYRGAAYALGPELNGAASQMYAAEGQCFVLAACAVVSPAMRAVLCDTPEREQLLGEGGGFAMIYGPDGRPLCAPLPETEEGVLTAEVDLGMIAIAKSAADPVGHYSRPDVTRLLFNPEPAQRRRVETFDERPEPSPVRGAPAPQREQEPGAEAGGNGHAESREVVA